MVRLDVRTQRTRGWAVFVQHTVVLSAAIRMGLGSQTRSMLTHFRALEF